MKKQEFIKQAAQAINTNAFTSPDMPLETEKIYHAMCKAAHVSFERDMASIKSGWNTPEEVAVNAWPVYNAMFNR